MSGYYSRRLAAERLQACYDLASEPVRAYLEAEVDFVLQRTTSSALVLELGCGYGRVLARLAERAAEVVGIDTSIESLLMARRVLDPRVPVRLAAMDAADLALAAHRFDLTVCVQNGISAFAVDQWQLLAESVRVTRPGGLVLFSSYAASFWSHRLAWFEAQAAAGLIGEIDHRATGDGVIVGTDAFRATTVSPDGFRTRHLDVRADTPRNSGTPYRQLLEEGWIRPELFHEVGINSFSNSQTYRKYVTDLGAHIHFLGDLRNEGVGATVRGIVERSEARGIFWGFDLDVVHAAEAPGVSDPSPMGLSAREVCEMADVAALDPRTRVIELTEVCPTHDLGGITSKLAANIVARALARVSE